MAKLPIHATTAMQTDRRVSTPEFKTTGLSDFGRSPIALSADKPLIHQHFSTIAEPLAEVNRTSSLASLGDALGRLLIPSAEIRRLTHPSSARGELGVSIRRLGFSIGRMGGEGGEMCFWWGLAAT